MYYYLVYIVLVLALCYRLIKYSTFFSKNIVQIKIGRSFIIINAQILLFILSVLVVFGNIKILDTVIVILLSSIVLTFFKIKTR